MDIRCGIDMIELDRFERALKSGEGFKKKVFTENETAHCGTDGRAALQSLAARFCAKEAVAKALGTGIAKGISFKDIEIVNEKGGKPKVILHGAAGRIYEEMNAASIDISLTHCRNYAAAQAVILIKG